MKKTRLIMGMPVTVEVIDSNVKNKDFEEVFNYFKYIDKTFSPYKKSSELSKINTGLPDYKFSKDMKTIFALSEETKRQTRGYFNILNNGKYDTSGIVKGWAILNASKILKEKHFKNFYIEAGGDIQTAGTNKKGESWRVGIRNPFNSQEIVKVLAIKNKGVATSGNYIRGKHIYNPLNPDKKPNHLVGFTVIGPNVYEADRYATAAFAMEDKGIYFIEQLIDFEGYAIDNKGIATMTNGFEKYVTL